MRIVIGKETIPLKNSEVKAAKKVISLFLNRMQAHEKEYLRPGWFLIILIVMHSMSGELLNEMDPENIKRIFERFSK